MFNEDQELFCIVAIIFFWCLCICSPLFIILSLFIAVYMCADLQDNDEDDDSDDEGSS